MLNEHEMNDFNQSRFEPVAERARDAAPKERTAAERQTLRQRALYDMLRRTSNPPADEVLPASRSFHEGLIVVIATYNDGKPVLDPSARINTIQHLLLALEHQRSALPAPARANFKIVVADNGLTFDQHSRLRDYFTGLKAQAEANGRSCPECVIVPAPKIRGNVYTSTAGYARNRALQEIRRRWLAGDNSYNAPVLIHDDDAVTQGIGDLYQVLSRNRAVVGAVAPSVQAVRNMARRATEIRSRSYESRRGPPPPSSSFPSVFDRDGLLNFSLLLAFGSTRVPKTCALLLHPRAIEDILSADGEVFHVWKNGSFEDMCLGISLACANWDMYRCEEAQAYDQVRIVTESRLRQQFGWAYDHATAFHDFSLVSRMLESPVVHPGVSVLVPLPKRERTLHEGWGLQRISQLDGFPGLQATIVRPEEVLEILRHIRDQLSGQRRRKAFVEEHGYAFKGCFETLENLAATVRVTLAVVEQVLSQLDTSAYRRVGVSFLDHEMIYSALGDQARQAEALRFERETRVARLLGNLGSMFRNPTNDFARGVVHLVALGPRQATCG